MKEEHPEVKGAKISGWLGVLAAVLAAIVYVLCSTLSQLGVQGFPGSLPPALLTATPTEVPVLPAVETPETADPSGFDPFAPPQLAELLPAQPVGLRIDEQDGSRVIISWNSWVPDDLDTSDTLIPVSYYKVYRFRADNGKRELRDKVDFGTFGLGRPSYTDDLDCSGGTYIYFVVAHNEYGVSPDSPVLTVPNTCQ